MPVRTKPWRGVSRRSDRAKAVVEMDQEMRRSGCGEGHRDGGEGAAVAAASPVATAVTGGGRLVSEACDVGEALLRACFVTGAVAEEYVAVALFGDDDAVTGIGWIVEFSHRPEDEARFAAEARAALTVAAGCGRGVRNVLLPVAVGTLLHTFGEMGVASVPHHLVVDRVVVEELLYRIGAADLVKSR